MTSRKRGEIILVRKNRKRGEIILVMKSRKREEIILVETAMKKLIILEQYVKTVDNGIKLMNQQRIQNGMIGKKEIPIVLESIPKMIVLEEITQMIE